MRVGDARGVTRDRRPAVPRRPRERLPHALDRGDGRATAVRPGRDRAGERGRHAHDQARLRRLPRRAGPGRAPRRRGRQEEADRAGTARVVAAHEGDASVAAYSVVHGRDGEPGMGVARVRPSRRRSHLRAGSGARPVRRGRADRARRTLGEADTAYRRGSGGDRFASTTRLGERTTTMRGPRTSAAPRSVPNRLIDRGAAPSLGCADTITL